MAENTIHSARLPPPNKPSIWSMSGEILSFERSSGAFEEGNILFSACVKGRERHTQRPIAISMPPSL